MNLTDNISIHKEFGGNKLHIKEGNSITVKDVSSLGYRGIENLCVKHGVPVPNEYIHPVETITNKFYVLNDVITISTECMESMPCIHEIYIKHEDTILIREMDGVEIKEMFLEKYRVPPEHFR